MSKAQYSKQYKVSRPTIDRWITNGDLEVENVSGVDYILIPQHENSD